MLVTVLHGVSFFNKLFRLLDHQTPKSSDTLLRNQLIKYSTFQPASDPRDFQTWQFANLSPSKSINGISADFQSQLSPIEDFLAKWISLRLQFSFCSWKEKEINN